MLWKSGCAGAGLPTRSNGWSRGLPSCGSGSTSENDSFVRDNQVKPEWDRVVDRLRQARADADSARVELAGFLEEGRRANALPGWLREGEDQEPPAEPEKKKQRLPAPQSIEPPVLGENNDERPPGV